MESVAEEVRLPPYQVGCFRSLDVLGVRADPRFGPAREYKVAREGRMQVRGLLNLQGHRVRASVEAFEGRGPIVLPEIPSQCAIGQRVGDMGVGFGRVWMRGVLHLTPWVHRFMIRQNKVEEGVQEGQISRVTSVGGHGSVVRFQSIRYARCLWR